MNKIRTAVVGLGYWGPNLVRNIHGNPAYELAAICDADPKRLERVGGQYPWAKRFTSVTEMLQAAKLDLVVVATPVKTHHPIAMAALSAGCNVLCEKPLAETVARAEELVEVARRNKLHLFVDHTFIHTSAVRAIREKYSAGALGDLFYVDSVRINLGLFQPDIDVIWDLAPHDLSILSYVIGKPVKSVRATGSSHNPREFVDVSYLAIEYAGGLTAHLHLSWLSPVKVRRMIFSGTKSSLIYDDLEPSEKVKLYDHGVSFDVADLEARKQVQVNYRRGEMRAPALDAREALAVELAEIASTLAGAGSTGPATGEQGLEVVRVLEASQRSLAADGARVQI